MLTTYFSLLWHVQSRHETDRRRFTATTEIMFGYISLLGQILEYLKRTMRNISLTCVLRGRLSVRVQRRGQDRVEPEIIIVLTNIISKLLRSLCFTGHT